MPVVMCNIWQCRHCANRRCVAPAIVLENVDYEGITCHSESWEHNFDTRGEQGDNDNLQVSVVRSQS